jgi:hypothetical protein
VIAKTPDRINPDQRIVGVLVGDEVSGSDGAAVGAEESAKGIQNGIIIRSLVLAILAFFRPKNGRFLKKKKSCDPNFHKCFEYKKANGVAKYFGENVYFLIVTPVPGVNVIT